MNSIEGLVQQVQELTDLTQAQGRTIEEKDVELASVRTALEDLKGRMGGKIMQEAALAVALHDVVKYTRLARGIQNPAGQYPNGPWEDFYACDDVLHALAAPQQHAQAPDLCSVTCWVETEEGGLCQALARASDIKDPDNAFVRLSAVLKLLGVSQQNAQAALSADQIEDLMPENEGNNGAFPCDKCGWIQVSAQWLHDFANNVHRVTRQPAPVTSTPAVAVASKEIPTELLKALNKHCCENVAWIRHAWMEYVAAAAQGDALTYDQIFQRGRLSAIEDYKDSYQQGRASGLEEAAKVCDNWRYQNSNYAGHCADAIRALNKTGAA